MNPLSLRLAIAFLFLTLITSSCRKEFISEPELIQYVSDIDNGVTKSLRVGPNLISVSWQPTDLLVARELRGVDEPSAESIARARTKYSAQHYFIVRLSRNGNELVTPTEVGLDGFSQLNQLLSFEMGDKVSIVTSKRDTLAVADYVYNRTFGAARSSDLLFAFRKEQTSLDDKAFLELNLDEFGLGIGKQIFRFAVADLNETPKIYFTE